MRERARLRYDSKYGIVFSGVQVGSNLEKEVSGVDFIIRSLHDKSKSSKVTLFDFHTGLGRFFTSVVTGTCKTLNLK
mgnify:CR=1 FL=1